MCIAIVTNSHPDYPLILLSNRDEYLQRPTAPASWWDEPHTHVLGGRDLHRAERGTWLGITRQGRLACLTNFREEGQSLIEGRGSRGAIVNSFLKTPPDSRETHAEVAHKLIEEGVDGIGGFSLLFGRLTKEGMRGAEGLAIVSNRSVKREDVTWILRQPGETHALSNSHFSDKSWPKVTSAEELVAQAVHDSVASHESKDSMISRFLDILSLDTLPRRQNGEEMEVYMRQLRNSILIPSIGDSNLLSRNKDADQIASARTPLPGTPNPSGMASINATGGVYGTQKQSVVLVDKDGKVTFFERTLFDGLGRAIEKGEADRTFEFEIEDWDERVDGELTGNGKAFQEVSTIVEKANGKA